MTSMMRKSAIAVVLCAGLCGAAWTPPSDAEVDLAIATFNAALKDARKDDPAATAKATKEAAAASLSTLTINELTIEQMERLNTARLFTSAEKNEEAAARLRTLVNAQTIDGARASALLLAFPSGSVPPPARDATPEDARKREQALAQAKAARTKSLEDVLAHPGLPEAVSRGGAGTVFERVAFEDDEFIRRNAARLALLGEQVNERFPAEQLPAMTNFYESLMRAGEAVDPVARERVRVRLADVVRTASAKVDPSSEPGTTLSKRLKRAEAFIDGAYARGDLVGHPAPQINITWTNSKQPLKTLADLKGKVVILDFWATWCGPCIGSFPDVKKLAAHYEGYPVEIIGVTSLQGYHISRPEGARGTSERIDCKDDPEKELGLMPQFIEQLGITWTVAFAKEDVFNPDYGVRGIPHVAIIDPAGILRYRGIHPSSSVTPFSDKVEKIDGLLKEFRLPTPPPLEEAAPEKK